MTIKLTVVMRVLITGSYPKREITPFFNLLGKYAPYFSDHIRQESLAKTET